MLPASRLRDSRTAPSRGSCNCENARANAQGAISRLPGAARSDGAALLKTTDHGDPLEVCAHAIGALGERWVEPFLQANAPPMQRLRLQADVCADSEVYVRLTPGARIGAMPLVGPATRRVVAGILVGARFRWPALGAVFNSIGFTVEPALGGSPLVPGCARDVPPWILAGPVIQRVAALLRHSRRSFVEHQETRSSPRGRVLWPSWISTQLPRGAWTQFPCRYLEPEGDPGLLANARWTLSRLMEELSRVAWSPPGRFLLRRTDELLLAIGPGTALRPGVQPAESAAAHPCRMNLNIAQVINFFYRFELGYYVLPRVCGDHDAEQDEVCRWRVKLFNPRLVHVEYEHFSSCALKKERLEWHPKVPRESHRVSVSSRLLLWYHPSRLLSNFC